METDFQILTLKELERAHIVEILNMCKGNILRASKFLGVSRAGLYSKLRIHGLNNVNGVGIHVPTPADDVA